jgi:putative transposase
LAIHAYVFMTNHVHLLATGSDASSVARALQMLGRRYVSYFNYLHERTGTLWEGRYHSSPIEADRYLLACHRYVEMNPVRANIVPDPLDFLWSSHRCLAAGRSDDLVTPHKTYIALAADPAMRLLRYRHLFDENLDPRTIGRIRDALNSGLALGSRAFCRFLEEETGRRVTRAAMGRPARKGVQAALQPDGAGELF